MSIINPDALASDETVSQTSQDSRTEAEGGRKEDRSYSRLSQASQLSLGSAREGEERRTREGGGSVGDEEVGGWDDREVPTLEGETEREEETLTRMRSQTESALDELQDLTPQRKSSKKEKKKRRRSSSFRRQNSVKPEKHKDRQKRSSVGDEDAAEEELWHTWSTLMKNWEETAKRNHKLIKQLVRQGIPEHLRGMAWQLLADAHDEELKDMYPALIAVGHPCLVSEELNNLFASD